MNINEKPASVVLPVVALQQRTFSFVPGLAFAVLMTLHIGRGAPGPRTVICELPVLVTSGAVIE